MNASYRGETSCFYDTNVIAAYILNEEGRVEAAAQVLHNCSLRGASMITLHELVYLLSRRGLGDSLEDAVALVERGLRLHVLGREAAITAAQLRLRYRLPEVDSLILATAVTEGYSVFYSFDRDFAELSGKTIGSTKIHYLDDKPTKI